MTTENTGQPAQQDTNPQAAPAQSTSERSTDMWEQTNATTAGSVHPEVTETPAQPAVQPAQPTQQPAGAAVQPATLPALDAKTIAEAVAAGVKGVLPQQQQSQQPQVSEAELAKQFNIYTATPEVFESILGFKPERPEQVAALNTAFQGLVKQAVTIAAAMQERSLTTFRDSLNPYISATTSTEAERQRTIFTQENPDLVGYDALVKQQYELAKANGIKFASVDQARKYIADQTRSTLKTLGITPAAPTTNGTNTTKPGQAPDRQMAPTSMGGRSGSGGSASKPTTHDIWKP